MHNVESRTLHVKCRDWDRVTRDDSLGEASVNLAELDARRGVSHARTLELIGGKGGSGTSLCVDVFFCYT